MRMMKKIKNLIRWFKIIWNDQDFEQTHIYNILKFKLENVRNELNLCTVHENLHKNELKYINICIKILNKLILDDFYINVISEEARPSYEKWGANVIDYKIVPHDEYLRMIGNYDKIRQKHVQLLFKILGSRIERFWC